MFHDMIADMERNKKICPLVTKLCFKGKNSMFLLFLYHNLISKYLKL